MSVKEQFDQTRERYSILTTVWWTEGNRLAANGNLDAEHPVDAEHPGADENRQNGDPPKFAIMFKGSPDGTIIRDLQQTCDVPPYLLLQTQAYGSYRASDMVDALGWMLPNAQSSEESMVVLLDWYSGHLKPEVEELVRGKGHVLIFHGGGTTPFTQVNDTHLHAEYQRKLIETEVQWMHEEAKDCRAKGFTREKKNTREEIVYINKIVWDMIDHDKLAAIGYLQTGPGLPMEGPVKMTDVGKELRKVWEEIDPGERPGELGTTIRDEAIKFIKEGWGLRWSSWQDAYDVVDPHDYEDEPVEEGLEGWPYDIYRDEDGDDSGGDEGGGDEGGGGGDGPGGGGGGHGGPGEDGGGPGGDGGSDMGDDDDTSWEPPDDELSSVHLSPRDDGEHTPEGDGGEGDGGEGGADAALAGLGGSPGNTDAEMEDFLGDEEMENVFELEGARSARSQDSRSAAPPSSEGLALVTCAAPHAIGREAPPFEVALAPEPSAPSAGGSSSAAPVGVSAAARAEEVAKARQVLIAEAQRTGDDCLLRRLLRVQTDEARSAKAAATEGSKILAERLQRERQAREDLAEQAMAKRKREFMDMTQKKRDAAEKMEAAAEAKQKALRMSVAARRDAMLSRKSEALARQAQRWLQVDYPVELAMRCCEWHCKLVQNKQAYQQFRTMIGVWLQEGRFDKRQFEIFPQLWTPIDAFTVPWADLRDNVGPMDGRKGATHKVRMSANFLDVLAKTDKRPAHEQTRDPITSLSYLFRAIIPYAHDIFAPTRRLGLHKLLGRNNYVMEAAFVAGVVGLAKFFDEPQWPCGVYKWPPESPPEFAEHVEVPLALSPGAVPAGSSAGSSVGTLASAAAGSSSAMAEKKATPPH